MSSSYVHLLSGSYSVTNKPISSPNQYSTAPLSSRLAKPEELSKFQETNKRGYESRGNNNDLPGNIDVKMGNNKAERPSSSYAKTSYVRDSKIKEIPIQDVVSKHQERIDDISSQPSVRLSEIEKANKQYQQRTNNALNFLLNCKPLEDNDQKKNTLQKDYSYSSLLKEIDDCVNNMKKYSLSNSSKQFEQSKRSTEITAKKEGASYPGSAALKQRQNIQEKAKFYQIQPKSSEGNPGYASASPDIVPKKPTAVEPKQYKSQLASLKVEAKTKERSASSSLSESESLDQEPKNKGQRVNQTPTNQRITENKKLTDSRINLAEKEKENVLVHDRKESGEYNRQSSRSKLRYSTEPSHNDENKEHKLYDIVKSTLSKEKLSSNPGDLIEIICQAVIKVMQNLPNKSQDESLEPRAKKIKRGRMIIEKLEPVSYVPPAQISARYSGIKTYNTQYDEYDSTFMNPKKTSSPNAKLAVHQLDENNLSGYKHTSHYEEEEPVQVSKEGKSTKFFSAFDFSDKKEGKTGKYFSTQGFESKNFLTKYTEEDKPSTRRLLTTVRSPEKPDHESISISHEKPPIHKSKRATGSKILGDLETDRSDENRVFGQSQNTPQATFKKRAGLGQNILHEEHNISPSKLSASQGRENLSGSLNKGKEPTSENRTQNRLASPSVGSLNKDHQATIKNSVGTRSTSNLRSPGLKTDVENEFFDKVRSMQENFSSFLKQKVKEVQETNYQFANNKEHETPKAQRDQRDITPIKVQSILDSNRATLLKQSIDVKSPIMGPDSAVSKPQSSSETKMFSAKQFNREERAAELPMKVSGGISRKKEWLDLNLQEENEIDQAILNYI